MSDVLNQFKNRLKDAGYSCTEPRLAVFIALTHSERLSLAALQKACLAIDRATIYRTVTLFEQLGIVQRLQQGWKYQLELSAAYSHHHHHLICNNCGWIQEIYEDAALESRIVALALSQKFTPQDHQIEIRGLCHLCQAAATTVA